MTETLDDAKSPTLAIHDRCSEGAWAVFVGPRSQEYITQALLFGQIFHTIAHLHLLFSMLHRIIGVCLCLCLSVSSCVSSSVSVVV